MTINDQIRDENLQYDINKEAAKISALSSGKINKYEYLTGEDILPSNQHQIIEQARFTYSPLGKSFEKQIKTIEDQGQKQVEVLNTLKSNNQLTIEDVITKNALNNDEAKHNLDKIKEIEKNVDREKLIYEINEYTYIFKNFQTIKTFDRDIYEGKITFEKANEYQTNLLAEIIRWSTKNCAPFTSCISKINNTQIDKAKCIDIVMPMCNLIEYSDNYSKTSGSL